MMLAYLIYRSVKMRIASRGKSDAMLKSVGSSCCNKEVEENIPPSTPEKENGKFGCRPRYHGHTKPQV